MKQPARIIVLALAAAATAAAAFADNPRHEFADDRRQAGPVRDYDDRELTRLFAKEARSLGLSVQFKSCRTSLQVAVPAPNGDISYGAICRVVLGKRQPRDVVVCTGDDGFTISLGGFSDNTDWVENFVRNNC